MRRASTVIARRTHSSSISRQAQVIPLTASTAVLPPSPPTPRIKNSSAKSSNNEKVKEWVDIFDGPMRPAVFVSPSPSASARENDEQANSIIFDGPARPRYIIPGAGIQNPGFPAQSQGQGKPTSPSTTQGKDVSALLSRSSLPPPRTYDGPAFEWELQTKRV